jgi:hypothetical protein
LPAGGLQDPLGHANLATTDICLKASPNSGWKRIWAAIYSYNRQESWKTIKMDFFLGFNIHTLRAFLINSDFRLAFINYL